MPRNNRSRRSNRRSRSKKFDVNKNTIIGALSALVLFIEVAGMLVLFASGEAMPGWLDFIFLIVFSYVVYKIFYKREELSTSVWFIALILLIVALMAFFAGIIIGVMRVYSLI